MGSLDNWFAVLRRAIDEGAIEVGVDNFRAGRHPASPVKVLLYFNQDKMRQRALNYAYRNVTNWNQLWEIGAFQLRLKGDESQVCNPGGDWVRFVKEHCMQMLKGEEAGR